MPEQAIDEIRDALLPNTPKNHPRVELISHEEWKLIATLHEECVFYTVHIEHTEEGDGVLIAYRDDAEDVNAFGPLFGDSPVPNAAVVPVTRFTRRARPRHIFAKLDGRYFTPDQSTDPRESGPYIRVEEWYPVDGEGQTNEKQLMGGAKRSQDNFMLQIEEEQKRMERELEREREAAPSGGP